MKPMNNVSMFSLIAPSCSRPANSWAASTKRSSLRSVPTMIRDTELLYRQEQHVLFNYHISVDGMLYSVSYEYIKKKVDVKVTDTTIKCQDRMYKNTPSHSLKFIFVVSIVLFFYMLIIIPIFCFKFCFFIPFLHLKLKYYWYCNFNVIIISLSRQRFLYVRLCL